jgi:hypothetical protein
MSLTIIENLNDYDITEEKDWWVLYDMSTKKILSAPTQCAGTIASIYSLILYDDQEEFDLYLEENGISFA